MTERKLELTFEQQMVLNASLILACLVFIGTLLTPIFDTELAIKINHAMIALLPDSFDPLKFASNDGRALQNLQLVFANLPLLVVVLLYCASYFMVFAIAQERPLQKIVLYVLCVYGGFYTMGFLVSTLIYPFT